MPAANSWSDSLSLSLYALKTGLCSDALLLTAASARSAEPDAVTSDDVNVDAANAVRGRSDGDDVDEHIHSDHDLDGLDGSAFTADTASDGVCAAIMAAV